jgi:hypothetical protein
MKMKNTISQYATDELIGKSVNVNGKPMRWSTWNLLVTKRDLNLYVNFGMKPHRHWRVTDVKKYFGIKGTGQNLLNNFMKLYNEQIKQS